MLCMLFAGMHVMTVLSVQMAYGMFIMVVLNSMVEDAVHASMQLY